MTRVLWFHPRPLHPVRGGGEVRTSGLVTAAREAGHDVLVVQAGAVSGVPEGLRVVGVLPRTGPVGAAAKIASRDPLRSVRPRPASLAAARDEVRDFAPEAAVVADVFSWPLARRLLPAGVPWIYDAHNVETILFATFRELSTGLTERATFAIDARRVAATERRLVDGATTITCVSASDAREFSQMAPGARVTVVPSSVATPPTASDPATTAPVMLFVGTLDYPPNTAAVRELVAEVLPLVRLRCPDARLLVVGRRASHTLRRLLTTTPGVELREDVPDIGPAYAESRCTVMPIRSGGGSRLKLLEALAHGLPVVATPTAADGVALVDEAVTLAESAPGLAEAALQHLMDPRSAAEHGDAGRRWFQEHLTWRQAAAPMLALLDGQVASR